MRSLYLRIWLTVVASLALFALVTGWLVQRHLEGERERFDRTVQERVEAWTDLIQRALPAASEPREDQADSVRELGRRLRVPLALDDAAGQRIAASEAFLRREVDGGPGPPRRMVPIRLEDGRTLWAMRMGPRGGGPRGERPWLGRLDGGTLAALLAGLLAAVALGAWPVVRHLTRRLEALKRGVDAFGAGALHQRVAEDGRDEVAALGASFNRSAARIEALLRSHQSLLANASHELRSPLARLKMALAMQVDASPAQRERLQTEIDTNIAELDALVEEVLLASRLDVQTDAMATEPVDLLGLLAEEGARVCASVAGESLVVPGDERLLRRALRNLLENARRYGADGAAADIDASVLRTGGQVCVRVCDRGAGVPEAQRERIFEPFFRLPGHAERAGGVGLGLALVRQIARRHGGTVACLPRDGGGSCFELRLPLAGSASSPSAAAGAAATR